MQVTVIFSLIFVAVVVCICFIGTAQLHSKRGWVALEGRSSGGELEDQIALSRAIGIAVKTKQTDLLTYPQVFNETLDKVAPYVDETDTAMDEGKEEKELNTKFAYEGTDPW